MDKLTFYNLVLSKLGVAVRVASLTEASSQRLALDAAYTVTIQAMLRQKAWNMAERRVALDDLDSATPSAAVIAVGDLNALRSDWTYRYLLPYDCIAVREVCPATYTRNSTGLKIPYEIGYEYGTTTPVRALYTDLYEAEVIYTADISEELRVWEPLFTQAAAYAVATELAYTMTGKAEIVDAMRRGYLTALGQAAAANFNERLSATQAEGSLITGRF